MQVDPTLGPPSGALVIEKIVREHIPLHSGDGSSYGQLLDESLRAAAQRGEEVQKVEFHIEPEFWNHYAQAIRQTYGGSGEAIPADEWGAPKAPSSKRAR